MRRLIVLIVLLFASVSYASQGMGPGPGLGKFGSAIIYCTGAATCTATYPDQCDAWCEDYAGSSSCASTYDSVCRNTYTAGTSGTGSIDFTNTASSGYPCTNTTNVLVLTAPSSSSAYTVFNAGSAKNVVYLRRYFKIDSNSIANGADATIAQGCADSGCTQQLWTVFVHNTGGTLSIRAKFLNSSSSWVTLTGSNISNGTWYNYGLRVDKDNSYCGLWLDGSAQASSPVSITFNARNQQYFRTAEADATSTIEFGDGAMDYTAMPGACQ